MEQDSSTTPYCPFCLNPVNDTDEACPWCSAPPEGEGWPEDPHVGRTLEEKYNIEQRLSADGMAIAFRATSVADGKAVVLKLLHPERASDPILWQTFVEHVQAAQDIDGMSFAKILYVGMDMDNGDIPYIVHEVVRGETLAELLARDLAFDIPEALKIGRHVALGMQKAHDREIVHRHLRPEKILVLGVRESDPVKILDLGFAAVSPKEEVTTPDLIDALRYLPPEGDDDPPNVGTDMYALGVMLYEMLAGQPPPASKGTNATGGELIRLEDLVPSLPEDLGKLVHEMMDRDPGLRPSSMKEVVTRLDRIDDELSTETIDSLIPQGAEHVDSPPRLLHKPSAVRLPSPAVKSPGDMRPRRIIGGDRYSAEIFNRPTKPPAGGKRLPPVRYSPERKAITTPASRKEARPAPARSGRSLAEILADRRKRDGGEAKIEAVKPIPPPPIDIEEVLPHLKAEKERAAGTQKVVAKPQAEPEPVADEAPEILAADLTSLPPDAPTEDEAVVEETSDGDVVVETPDEERQEERAAAALVPAGRPRSRALTLGAAGVILLIGVVVLAGWLIGMGGNARDGEETQEVTEPDPDESGSVPAVSNPKPPGQEAVKPPVENIQVEPVVVPPPEVNDAASDATEHTDGKDEDRKEKKKKDEEESGKKKGKKKWELLFTPKK